MARKAKKRLPKGQKPSNFRHIKNHKQRAFLLAYARWGVILTAGEVSGVNRNNHQYWLKRDADYAAAFAEADQEFCDRVQNEIFRRAVDGVQRDDIRLAGTIDEEIIENGKITGRRKTNRYEKVGTIHEYADTLLLALANARMPAYGRYRHEISGPAGGAIPIALFDAITEEVETSKP